jgi:hypothetical protein
MNQDLERSLSHAGHEDNEDACGRRKRGATAAADRMAGSGSRRCWAVERGEPTEQKLGEEGEWCALSLCGVWTPFGWSTGCEPVEVFEGTRPVAT